ncbi:MAG: DsbA family protein [bacterium]
MLKSKKKNLFNFAFKNSSNFLVILLIVLAFFTGYLFFKVQSLQQGGVPANGQAAPAEQPAPELNLDTIPAVTNKDHIRGDKNAKIVLVEYSDFECPFCKDFHLTMQQLMKDYGSDIAWVYRHYPLSFHENAAKEAEASECVAELSGNDSFWKYIDLIFEKTQSNGTSFEVADLKLLAEEVGVNGAKFQECLDSDKFASLVADQMKGGAEAGIQGTPGTVIITKDGKKDLIGGALPVDQAKTQIDALLK